MKVSVLGPVGVRNHSTLGPVQRRVLAVLAARGGQIVSAERLASDSGDLSLPAVRTTVSRLRRVLGTSIRSEPPGYLLDPDDIDASEFEKLVALARGIEPAKAIPILEEALGLWQGPAFAEFADLEWATGRATQLNELRWNVAEDLIDRLIVVGRAEDAAVSAQVVIAEQPFRERPRYLMMQALDAQGRQTEALRSFQVYRDFLANEVGTEPTQKIYLLDADIGGGRTQDGLSATDEDLPSGYVTFVFTDVEGSTQLLKRLGDEYIAVAEDLDTTLTAAFESHAGHIIDKSGDSMFVAFADANRALEACTAAQRSITRESWPGDSVVKLRIGLHLGLAQPRRQNYIALAVNQAARVMAAAHGGQILMTQAVVDEAGPERFTSVLPIGRYRLRDFEAPPMLYQDAEWARTSARPVRATPTTGHNIRAPQTTFFDREAELEDITQALKPGSVVSLVGPGGVGKSRLASHLGIDLAPEWPDGVWVADLAELDEPSLVAEQVAAVIGAETQEAATRIQDIVARLRSQNAIVIYDGFERHIDACAELVATIQRECPGVGQFATGRESLRIPGEIRIRISPLPVVADGSTLSLIRRADATKLFLDRARAVEPRFELDDFALRSIADICRHVDGLPLAIEIAAARVDVMSVDEIVDALEDRFRLLRSRDRALPIRQRTMQGVLDWSADLLTEDERVALRRLAIFNGGFTRDTAAVAVAGADHSAEDVPELLWSLVDKSLVVADRATNPTTYRLLETVQAYGRDQMRSFGEDTSVAHRVATAFDERTGPDRPVDQPWLNQMHLTQSNMRTVLGLVTDAHPELAQRLACSLGRYHNAVQSFRPGIEELSRYVVQLIKPTPTRVGLLIALADLHLRDAAVAQAKDLVNQADELAAEVGVPSWDDAGIDRAQGDIAVRAGEPQRAEEIALTALKRGVSTSGTARMWNLLGLARASRGDNAGAFEAYEEELAIYLELGVAGNVASAHGNIAECALRDGELVVAATHQSECLDLALALGQPVMLAYSSVVAAQLASRLGDWETAIALESNAHMALDDIGHTLYASDDQASEALQMAARAKMHHNAFDQARSLGRGLDPVEAAGMAGRVFAVVRRGSLAI